MLNRFASLLLVLAVASLSGCSVLKGDSEDWDGRDPFAEAARKAPLTDEFKQRFGLGLTLLEQGAADEALAHWQGMTADYPQYPGVWVNYGLAQAATGAWDIAALAYQEALTINAEYCDAWSLKGLAQREQGLFDPAQVSYEAAITCDPEQGAYYYNLGILFDLYRNELPSALTAYRMARRLMPDDEQLNVWVIDLARRTDQPEEDPQRIDDWYYDLTGTRPVAVADDASDESPEESPEASDETSTDSPVSDAPVTEPEAAQAEDDSVETFRYNDPVNPFLPDDTTTDSSTDTSTGTGETSE